MLSNVYKKWTVVEDNGNLTFYLEVRAAGA